MINFQFYMYELTQIKLSFLHVKKFSVLHLQFDIEIVSFACIEIFSFTFIEIFKF